MSTVTSWHQDRGVAHAEADATDMVTVWIAMTDATEENGCLVAQPFDGRAADAAALPDCGRPRSRRRILRPRQGRRPAGAGGRRGAAAPDGAPRVARQSDGRLPLVVRPALPAHAASRRAARISPTSSRAPPTGRPNCATGAVAPDVGGCACRLRPARARPHPPLDRRPAPIARELMTRTIRLHAADNVVTAIRALEAGAPVEEVDDARPRSPPATRSRRRPSPTGAAIRKYGQIIGYASVDIAAGDHVHVQNCAFAATDHDYDFAHRPAASGARDGRHVHGLPARERRRGHAQLRRDRHLGELLGHRRATHRRRLRARRAGRLSQRRRGGGLRARHRLRHGRRRRRVRGAAAGDVGLRASTRTTPAC